MNNESAGSVRLAERDADPPENARHLAGPRGTLFQNLNRVIRSTWNWLSPIRVWREICRGETARRDLAAGLAIGVFIACVPLYGLQTVLCFFAARRMSLHPLPVIAGSQLSAPPFAPALTFASVVLGHAVISRKLTGLTNWHVMHWAKFSMAGLNSFVLAWLIGGILLGLILAGITYAIAYATMHLVFNRANPTR